MPALRSIAVDNRREVRDFLVSRRAKITPDRAGLAAHGSNRRVPGLRREEVALLAESLTGDFPDDVAAAVGAIARHDSASYAEAVERVRRSFDDRGDFLEDVPVPDTALALDALAARRGLS